MLRASFHALKSQTPENCYLQVNFILAEEVTPITACPMILCTYELFAASVPALLLPTEDARVPRSDDSATCLHLPTLIPYHKQYHVTA